MLFFWLWKKKRLIVGKSAAKALMAAIGSLTSRFQGSVANSKSTLFKEGQLARDTSQSIPISAPASNHLPQKDHLFAGFQGLASPIWLKALS